MTLVRYHDGIAVHFALGDTMLNFFRGYNDDGVVFIRP